jgi:hypothetical protein
MNQRQRRVKLGADAVAVVLCAVGATLALADVHTPVRPGLVAAALVVGTGWAATNWMDLTEVAFAASVSLATGLSICFFVALLFVEVGWWHPVGSAGALLIAAAAGNALALARDTAVRGTVR